MYVWSSPVLAPKQTQTRYATVSSGLTVLCVCVCIFFPFILDIKFVGRTSRGYTGGRSHRIFHPPSFCGACLNFSREKDSAIPFPRRPWSRILCTNNLIVLDPLDIFFLFFLFFNEKNTACRGRTHVPTCQRVTRYLWATGSTRLYVCMYVWSSHIAEYGSTG